MKIKYVTNVRLPTPKAQGYAIMKMCSEFAKAGIETELVIPQRHSTDFGDNPFTFYNLPKDFKIREIYNLDLLGRTTKFGQLFYWIDSLLFLLLAWFSTKFESGDVLYTRDFMTALFFPKKNLICLELHSIPQSPFLFKRAIKKIQKFVVLTSFIKNKLVEFGIPSEDVFVSPSGVDVVSPDTKKVLKKIKNIPEDNFVYGYIGTLKTMGMEKGVADSLTALTLLPVEYTFLVVGGEPEDVTYYKNIAKDLGVADRVVFVGKVPQVEVAGYTVRCDALVAPFPENEHYSFFMSPLKIFEYMASKKPIIATELPSLQEVLTHGVNAVLIPPSDPQALADAIVGVREHPEYMRKIAEQAFTDVSEKYTWSTRVKRIVSFLRK